MEEHQLLALARVGNPAAERALYEAHVGRVYRMAYRMTGDEALAQDYTQDTFVRAFGRLDSFRGDAAFSTWLHTIANSVILNGLRKVKRTRERERPLDEHPRAEKPVRAQSGLRHALHRAVDDLSDALRVVFVMHDLEGFTHEEIATSLDIPVGTSKARLSRARQKLRQTLAGSPAMGGHRS